MTPKSPLSSFDTSRLLDVYETLVCVDMAFVNALKGATFNKAKCLVRYTYLLSNTTTQTHLKRYIDATIDIILKPWGSDVPMYTGFEHHPTHAYLTIDLVTDQCFEALYSRASFIPSNSHVFPEYAEYYLRDFGRFLKEECGLTTTHDSLIRKVQITTLY